MSNIEVPDDTASDGMEEVRFSRVRIPFIKRTIFGGGASLISAVGIFVSGILVARLLGPEGTGVVSLASWIIITSSMVAGLGLPLAIERFYPELEVLGEKAQARRIASKFVYLTLVGIALTSATLAGIWALVWRPIDGGLWAIVMVAVGFQALADYFFAYCRANQLFKRLAILSIFSVLIRLTILVAGALLIGVYGALIAFVAALAIPTFLALALLRGGSGRLSSAIKGRVIRLSATAWLSGIFYSVVWTRSEVVFIEAYWSVEEVGLFSAGLAVASIVVLLPSLLTTALLPFLSEKVGRGARVEIQSNYDTMIIIVSLLVLPACMGMAGIAPALVPLLFGKAFEAAVEVAIVLAAISALTIFSTFSHNLLFRFEKGWLSLLSNVLGLAVLVAAGLLVIPEYGIMGAAWARGGVHGVVTLLQVLCARWFLGFTLPYGALMRLLAAAVLCGLSAYAVLMIIDGPGALLLAIPVGALVYGACVRLTGALASVNPDILDRAAREAPFGLEQTLRIGIKLLRGREAARPGAAP